MPHGHDHHHDHTGGVTAPRLAVDPVCGMKVDPHTAKHRAEHAGRTYYFCSAGCREKFLADPLRYLHKDQKRPPPCRKERLHRPRHQRSGSRPGSCPIWAGRWSPCRESDSGPIRIIDRRDARTPRLDATVLELARFRTHGMDWCSRDGQWIQLTIATPGCLAGWRS